MELFGLELVRSLEQQGLEMRAQNQGRETSHKTAVKLFEFIAVYQSLIVELNSIKKRLDDSFKSKQVEVFKQDLIEFKRVAYRMWEAKAALKARRKKSYLLIHKELLADAYKKISYVENTINGAERWVKEKSMSPAQLAAAKKASLRMQMAWGI